MADFTDNNLDYSGELFAHEVRLVRTRKRDEDLLRLAKQRANDPGVFDQHTPIFFAVEASNSEMDAYYTRMAKNTLQNFETNARASVSFQDSHRTRELGLGGTLDAALEQDGDILRLTADVFTLGGLPDLDAFIHRWRAGIARDVSVGFYGGKHICALCNRSIWSWDCPHIPGVEYDVETRNDQGEVTSKSRQVAFAWIDGARLSEISAVYDGATPGCAILKAQREAESGRMTPDVANLLEARYRGLHLTAAHRRWAGIDVATHLEKVSAHSPAVTTHRANPDKGAISMSENNNPATPGQTGSQPGVEPSAGDTRSPATALPAKPEATATPDENARLVADLVTTAGLPAEVSGDAREVATHLRQMVSDGKAYRERVIGEALTAGVRLFGNDFDKEGTRALFERAGVEAIRKMGDQWSASADKIFPSGRQTVDDPPASTSDDKPEAARVPAVPATVYGG
ncbi:MAG TPA: hypothetical protein PKC13_18125 [Blastocatellia bacterium]|nr:hypothetical protein [Blastocatellia bacterium]